MLGLFALSVFYLFFADSGFLKVRTLARQQEKLQTEIADLRADNVALDRRIEDLKSNDVAIEREIRRQLEMIEPSEVIFLFDSDNPPSTHQ